MSIMFIFSLLIEFSVLSFCKGTFFSIDIGIILTTINIIITLLYISIKKSFYKLPILIGYVVRCIVMFVDLYGRGYVKLLHSGVDTEAFYRIGLVYGKGDFNVFGNNTPRGYYPKLLGVIFNCIGDHRIFAQYINVVLSILTILIFIKILEQMNINENINKMLVWIVSLFPTNIILSSILLRESIILFLVTLGLYNYIRYVYSGRGLYFIISSVFIVTSAIFHSGTMMLLFGLMVYQFFLKNSSSISINKIISVIGILILIMLFKDLIFRNFGRDGKLNIGVDEVLQNAGSGYLRNININTFSDIIKYGWIRSIYFVASPTPLYWRGLGDVVSFFTDSLLYVFIIFKVVISKVKLPSKLKVIYISLLIGIAFSIFTFGIGTANAGTALRHRNKLLIAFLIVFAIIENSNIDNKLNNERRRIMGYTSDSLSTIIQYIKKNIIIIILSMILVGGLGYGVTKYLIKPSYTSNATMMVGVSLQNNRSNENGDIANSNIVEFNESLVSTYSEIVKSRGVAEKVINNLSLDMDYGDFSEKVSIEPVKDTQIISVTVVDTIPERAQDIANETANIFKDSIGDIMKVDNVQILDGATLPEKPSSPNIKKNTAIGVVLGLILGVMISVIKELADTTIKTQDDINKYFDLPVIGIIPDKKQG